MTAAVWTLIAIQAATILGLFASIRTIHRDIATLRDELRKEIAALTERVAAIETRHDHFDRRLAALEQRQT